MSVASSGSAPYYFVPAPSKWPLVGSISMLFFMFGMSGLVNGAAYGPYAMAVGFESRTNASMLKPQYLQYSEN
ncbi:MAG: hypothetical protein EBS90_11390, partial [Betaproteobacteria bacterium]|nr:hypothetical protein [Betaproteobacteria bacterium]